VFAAAQGASPSVGIVGAGLAGLACADALASRGIAATVYEAANRVGGRCYSLRGFFPGQVAELGGELIDNPHKTMLGYARRFGLAVEDVVKKSGDVTFGVSTDVAQAATGPRRGQAPRRVAHPLHAGRDTCIAGLVQQRAAASSTRTRSAVR
jgi:monoamine oxidase